MTIGQKTELDRIRHPFPLVALSLIFLVADFDGLKESLAILNDIRISNEQIERGETKPNDEVFDRLLGDLA